MSTSSVTLHTWFHSVLGPAAGLALLLSLTGCEQKAAALASTAVEQPVAVESIEVATIKSPVLLRLTGTLKGARETELAANVVGRILKTDIQRGDSIEAGTLLAQVDTKGAQLALAEAKLSVETSRTQQAINQKDCERFEKLKATGVVTDQEYDQVTAKCKTAPLSVDAAQVRESIAAKNVGDGMVRAPFSGVVTERFIEVGEYVQASSRVVSIAQVDTLKLVFHLPERNFPDVQVGAVVHFRVAAYGEQQFEAKVARISGAVSVTRDIVVEAEVDNKDRKLLPGMFADMALVIGDEDLPSVPSTALFEQNGKTNIMVVKDGKLEQRIVQPVKTTAANVAVRRGLKPGDRIVKVADSKLKNGQKVL